MSSDSLEALLNVRRELVGGVLQPMAMDLLNTQAAQYLGFDLPAQYSLFAEMGGNRALMGRYQRNSRRLATSARNVTLTEFEGDRRIRSGVRSAN